MPSAPDIPSLSETLIAEIVKAFGLPKSIFLNKLFRLGFHKATDRLAALGLHFNRNVATVGIASASSALLSEFCQPVQVHGGKSIPITGPILIVSNHPGTFDALVILSQMNRPDVRFIASRIPFLASLPDASRHFIFVTINAHERMAGMRKAIRHLQMGGVVILFGSGHIDPDPAVYHPEEAVEHFQHWWPSVDFLLRMVPSTRLVLSMISNVVSPRWTRHPITWLRSGGVNQRRLAELGQLVQQLIQPEGSFLTPCINFSQPFTVPLLRGEAVSGGEENLMPVIRQHASVLLDDHQAIFGDIHSSSRS